MVNDDGFVMAMGDADEFVGVKEKLTAVHWVLLLLLLLLLLLMPLSNSVCPEWTEFPIFTCWQLPYSDGMFYIAESMRSTSY